MRQCAHRHAAPLDRRRDRLVEQRELQRARRLGSLEFHRVEPEIPFRQPSAVTNSLVVKAYVVSKIARRSDRARVVQGERLRADRERYAAEEAFAIGGVRPLRHKADRNVELVAFEIGFVVARDDAYIDARMYAIESRQSRCEPERSKSTGR